MAQLLPWSTLLSIPTLRDISLASTPENLSAAALNWLPGCLSTDEHTVAEKVCSIPNALLPDCRSCGEWALFLAPLLCESIWNGLKCKACLSGSMLTLLKHLCDRWMSFYYPVWPVSLSFLFSGLSDVMEAGLN